MARLKTDTELSTEPSKTKSSESDANSPADASHEIEAASETDDLRETESPDDEPRSGSISSLLRRLEGVDPETKTGGDEVQDADREVSEMDAVLGALEVQDDPAANDNASEDEVSGDAARDAGDEYWGADGFEKIDDDLENRPDSYLLDLISELNGKLDRTHDAINRGLPPRVPDLRAFESPPVDPQRLNARPRGRIREMLMFTGMWGALIAAIIAVVYSNSWWLSEPPSEQARASVNEDQAAPERAQSLNRLGALGTTPLSEPLVSTDSPTGDPALTADKMIESRKLPRPANPDAPAASGDSATDAISSALAASGEEEPLEQGSTDEASTTPDASAPDAPGDRPGDAVPVKEAPRVVVTAPDGPTQHASSVTAVSEWRRMARLTAEPASPESARGAVEVDPGFTVGQVHGQAGRPIAIPIRVPQFAAETEASIMIRGLPEGSLLSAGKRAGESTWILSMSDLPNLRLMTPSDLAATEIGLEITLVTSDGSVPSTKLLTVELAAAQPEPAVEVVAPAPAVEPSAVPSASPANAREAEAAELLERGQELMKLGDIAGARLVLALAAELESVPAMVALAMTYDPVHLAKLGARGLRPDIHTAIAWYRRASEQGHAASRQRVEALVASAGR